MLLLIPGPVTTRPEVREALRHDFAPWDNDFRPLHAGIRERVLHIAHGVPGEHATLPLQGCGHFITEAAIRTFVPLGHKLLIPATGSYADRMIRLAREAGRIPVPLPLSPVAATDPDAVAAALTADPDISHVGLVYSETGSGIVHDVAAIGAVVRSLGRRMIVDAVSAFGALPLDLSAQPEIDVVGFTSNKCLEGVPGMAFAVARIDRVRGVRRQCRKLVARSVQHLRACAAQRLGQLPLHAAGAGAERVQRRARPLRCRGRPARAAGALHREHAHAV